MTLVKQVTEGVRAEAAKTIVGQDEALTALLTALLSGGHVLLEGVPGVAKTLLARTLAALLGGKFSRIQFTPDLMPSDVTGTSVYDLDQRSFRLRLGPIFGDVVLADEINRAPAKTQSSLLEAMQERQVSIDGETHQLPRHHVVIATRNPVEYEGTYPLPEASLDRFFFRVSVPYPELTDEVLILERHRDGLHSLEHNVENLSPLLAGNVLDEVQEAIQQVRTDELILKYIAELAQATRKAPDCLLGVSPRASIVLMSASRTQAAMEGRDFVTPDDVVSQILPAWSHRIRLIPQSEMDGLTPEGFLTRIVPSVQVPR